MEGKPIFEARPRKTNKAFYTEFMNDLQHVDYADFTKTLFGQIVRYGADLSFIKRDDKYFISANYDIVLPHTELTASQYQSAMEKLEK